MLCRSIPYAFWHLPLRDLPEGFPVFFDINLSQVGGKHCSTKHWQSNDLV